MLFNSHLFLFVFLPAFLMLWYSRYLSRDVRLIVLTLASYIFYGYWDWRFTILMVCSTVVDYYAGAAVFRATEKRTRRSWLLVSLATNLGLLGVFKYTGFAVASLNSVHAWLSSGDLLPPISIVLPLGISFYTFQSMSYTIDIYFGKAKPAQSMWHFAAYVSMFPQLIAGPIVRYREMDNQLRQFQTPPPVPMIAAGVHMFVVGLAKKLLIADPIAVRIDGFFDGELPISFATAWFAALGYSSQIYFDFSAYSDMAIGLGYMLGFRLPQNFNSPYKSASITEFWRRWHMTLSSWLRDYLYIPLGGNRHGKAMALRNLLITMFLGGLWHGAAWTFVLWGLLHGAYLVTHNLWKTTGRELGRVLGWFVTCLAVLVGWVLFRAPSFEISFEMLRAMVSPEAGLPADFDLLGLGLIALALSIATLAPNSWESRVRLGPRAAFVTAVVFVVCVLRLVKESPFIYFQF